MFHASLHPHANPLATWGNCVTLLARQKKSAKQNKLC
jgi:hypothetical protein